MALSSPRFIHHEYLKKVSRNIKVLKKGNMGHAVHLVQQALLDLGFKLGESDGIFGDKTERAVVSFQTKHTLKQDGVVGIKTLSKLDSLLKGYQHRVRLHFRSISLTNVTFDHILSSTKLVYAQYGISVDMASGMSLYLSPQQMKVFSTLDSECNWNINAGEVFKLHGLGGSVTSDTILVYYVNQFKVISSGNTLNGCGGHLKNRPAVTVASTGTQWTTAHEVGHVLLTKSFLPVHETNVNNLMYSSTNAIPKTPMLTHKQLKKIRSHPCCKKV